MELAISNGYTIIRLLHEDVYNDKNDWESKLKDKIKDYDHPIMITICNENKYEKHLLDFEELSKIKCIFC